MQATMQANIVTDLEDFEEGDAGTVMFTQDDKSLMIKCPGCGEPSALPLDDSKDPSRPGWKFSGTHGNPTLHPSIHHDIPSCGWHGWLKDGIFK